MRLRKLSIARFTRVLTIFGVLLFSVTGLAANLPMVRVLTFVENNPWEAISTVLAPDGHGRYRTEELGAAIERSNQDCNNLLNRYQARSLKVMLDNKYITPQLYQELSNPALRVMDMRQYVLITLYEDMPRTEAQKLKIDQSRFLDAPKDLHLVRVHMGSIYAVRGYDLRRGLYEGFKLLPLYLPYEVEGLPAPLTRPLERKNMPLTVEIGRALVEEGADRQTFQLLMQLVTTQLAADANILGVEPEAFPVFGRADNVPHALLYVRGLGGKPMTPEMQTELEADPKSALADFAQRPKPTREYWAGYREGMIVGSLAQLLEKYPQDALSGTAARLRAKYPDVPANHVMGFLREFQMFHRADFDLTWHDPHRPGQRAPLKWHDWGTGLLEVRLHRLLKKHGFPTEFRSVESFLNWLDIETVHSDPDLGRAGWLDTNVAVGLAKGTQLSSEQRPPSITIGNLDGDIKNKASYLAMVILSFTAKLEEELKGLSAEEQSLLLADMNRVRGIKKLAFVRHADLKTFLETYDLNLSTTNDDLQTELKILGADFRDALQIDNHFKGGKVDVNIDLTKLGLNLTDLKDPAKLRDFMMGQMLNGLNSVFKFTRVYRFGYEEIEEMRQEYPQYAGPGAASFLAPSFHQQRMERLYGAFQ